MLKPKTVSLMGHDVAMFGHRYFFKHQVLAVLADRELGLVRVSVVYLVVILLADDKLTLKVL